MSYLVLVQGAYRDKLFYSVKKELQEFKIKDGNGIDGLDDKGQAVIFNFRKIDKSYF